MPTATRATVVEKSRARHARPARPALPSAIPYTTALLRWQRGVHSDVMRAMGLREDALDPTTQARLRGTLSQLHVRLGMRRPPMAAIASVAEGVRKHAAKEAKKLLGVPAHADVAPLITAFRAANVQLIQSLPQRLLADVDDLLTTFDGASVADLAEALRERFTVDDARAALIARDQTLKLNGQLQRAEQESVGCISYLWSSSKDERVRDGHSALDGLEFRWSDPPVVDERTGRREHPGQDFQCRCVAIPVLPDLLRD